MQTAIDYRDFIPNPGNWPSTSEQKKLVNLAREEIKRIKNMILLIALIKK